MAFRLFVVCQRDLTNGKTSESGRGYWPWTPQRSKQRHLVASPWERGEKAGPIQRSMEDYTARRNALFRRCDECTYVGNSEAITQFRCLRSKYVCIFVQGAAWWLEPSDACALPQGSVRHSRAPIKIPRRLEPYGQLNIRFRRGVSWVQ